MQKYCRYCKYIQPCMSLIAFIFLDFNNCKAVALSNNPSLYSFHTPYRRPRDLSWVDGQSRSHVHDYHNDLGTSLTLPHRPVTNGHSLLH